MACPNESNKEKKREEKVKKYQQLCYEIRERRDRYKVKIIPVVIGCLGGGMKRLKDDVKELFKNEKELQWICRENAKDCVVGKRDNYEKNTIWTIDMRCL